MAMKAALFAFVNKQLLAAITSVPDPVFVSPGLFYVRASRGVDHKFHEINSLQYTKRPRTDALHQKRLILKREVYAAIM